MPDYVGLETSGHVLLEDGTNGLLLETSLIVVTGPTPLNVAFTDLSTNTPTSWAWDFGDGGTSTVQNPTHTYATPGTYTVKLSTKTDKGCISDTSSKQVIINPLPSAKFGFSAPDCISKDITFSDSSIANAGNITLWKWDLGDG